MSSIHTEFSVIYLRICFYIKLKDSCNNRSYSFPITERKVIIDRTKVSLHNLCFYILKRFISKLCEEHVDVEPKLKKVYLSFNVETRDF